MGDHEAGAASQQLFQRLLDEALGARVHAGGGLVEDEDARVSQGGAGNGQQLALALAESGAAFAQHRLIFIGQALDEGIGVGQLGGLLHLFVAGLRAAEADVLHYGGAEQESILQYDADLLAQGFGGHVAHIMTVDFYRAASHIIETRDEIDDSGLASAGGTHDSDGLPGFGAK